MPAGNPLAYLIPQIMIPSLGAPTAPMGVDMGVVASLLGAQPTAMSAGASDIVRRGIAPVGAAPAPVNNTPAARAPASANLSGYSDQELMAFARKYNPQGQSADPVRNKIVWDEIKRRQQAVR